VGPIAPSAPFSIHPQQIAILTLSATKGKNPLLLFSPKTEFVILRSAATKNPLLPFPLSFPMRLSGSLPALFRLHIVLKSAYPS